MDMNFEQARANMVAQQIRPWEVLDEQVLETVLATPREEFVPAPFRALAFMDMEIPLGRGEVMMPPRVEARMVQTLALRPDDAVLEIGTGSGYVTALLAKLGGHVSSVDIHGEFTAAARVKLAAHGIDNVTLETGDAARGWGQPGRFDAIAVTGSLPVPTDDFQRALKVGGRMFIVVGQAPVMEAMLVERVGENEWRRKTLFETVVPPLANAPQATRFVL
jgi:protein-L-isoaspartate(D-aspartate) O-methyltransferase